MLSEGVWVGQGTREVLSILGEGFWVGLTEEVVKVMGWELNYWNKVKNWMN